jgi:hypothetical protein
LVFKSVLFLSLQLCRQSVRDALQEMILAYRQYSNFRSNTPRKSYLKGSK